MNYNDYDIMISKEKLQGISKNSDYLSYKDMIDYFTDNCKMSMILNNELINYEIDFWYCESGNDYDEENDYYYDVYQWYILNDGDAERLKENTNEIIYYNDKLGIYLLGVTHCGTSWDYVSSDFKKIHEDENYCYYKMEG